MKEVIQKELLIKRGIFFLVSIFVISVSSCKKSNSTGGGGGGVADVLRPATMSFFQGPVGGNGPVWTYVYNSDGKLLEFGEKDKNYRYLSPGKARFLLFDPVIESTTDYVYSSMGQPPVDLYDSMMSPNSVSIQTSILSKSTNQVTKPEVIEWHFAYNTDRQLVKEVTPIGEGREVNYFYDDQHNLQKIEFSTMVEPYWRVDMRTTITGYDDHPSPFRHVAGYRWASYPQYYNDQYAQAFCQQNPTQMKTERWSATKNDFYLNEQTDFTYTYNEQGYPTRIVVTTTYISELGEAFSGSKTYEFTYE